jgi:hypothetical protein
VSWGGGGWWTARARWKRRRPTGEAEESRGVQSDVGRHRWKYVIKNGERRMRGIRKKEIRQKREKDNE